MGDIAICDANILIDFLSANNGKIAVSAMSSLFSNIYVPDVILAEVSMLSEIEAKELKLKIVETPLNEVVPSENRGLSFQDNICLHFVRKNSWTCLTNDKKLRQSCFEVGGKAIWGLELLALLAEKGLITLNQAYEIEKDIYSSNKTITCQVHEGFLKRIRTNKLDK